MCLLCCLGLIVYTIITVILPSFIRRDSRAMTHVDSRWQSFDHVVSHTLCKRTKLSTSLQAHARSGVTWAPPGTSDHTPLLLYVKATVCSSHSEEIRKHDKELQERTYWPA